tara:strand:- start:3075 stop:3587 length:513 start_codon:yes stop_codon:yes gene_type:complete
MENRNKLKWCSIIYFIFLSIIIIIVFCFQSYDKYFRYGVPDEGQEPLVVLSVKIDNYYKYMCVLGLIAGIRIIKVTVSEITDPILSFTIYNPDKKNIVDFTKNELQFYANFLYLIGSIRYVFTLMITITQIDLALFSVLVGEITSLFTIRMLLNEKTFNKNYINLDNEII